MALTFTRYDEQSVAAQYVGGVNGADVVAYLNSIFGPGTCYLSGTTIINPQQALFPGEWLVKTLGNNYVHYTNAEFTAWFALPPVPTVIPDPVISVGTGTVPTLGAGASTVVTVTCKPAFVDNAWQAVAVVTGGLTVLGALSVTGVAVTGTATVDVTVKNNGLVSLGGGVVLVNGIHN